jgi:hypothetical protein
VILLTVEAEPPLPGGLFFRFVESEPQPALRTAPPLLLEPLLPPLDPPLLPPLELLLPLLDAPLLEPLLDPFPPPELLLLDVAPEDEPPLDEPGCPFPPVQPVGSPSPGSQAPSRRDEASATHHGVLAGQRRFMTLHGARRLIRDHGAMGWRRTRLAAGHRGARRRWYSGPARR